MLGAHSDLALLIDAVARTQGRLREAFADARATVPLGEMERTVLIAVVEAKRPPTVPQIGRSLGHPRQVIQRAANRLIEAGLILGEANPDHKRAQLLLPTPAGQAVQAAAAERAEVITSGLMNHIDPTDLRRATELLARIRAGIEAHDKERKA